MLRPAFTPSVPLRPFHARAPAALRPNASRPGQTRRHIAPPVRAPARRLIARGSQTPSQSASASASASAPSHASEASVHRLTNAARARTLVHVCNTGTLCTASQKHDGAPFGSHVDYILDAQGLPVVLLANGAAHTRNLHADNRCSLFVQPPSNFGQDGCRVTLVGDITPLPEDEVDGLREAYIDIHAHAADALQYPDLFKFHRMNLKDVFFVAGYGVVSQWVSVADFCESEPDPLAHHAPGIVKNLNENKEDDLRRLCKVFLGDPDPKVCKIAALDRLGFDMRVKDSRGAYREYRVGFREEVANRFDVQSALIKAFQEAWERENGYDETWADEDMRPTLLYYATSL
ncbi:Glutamyl-tRNA reductase-binding protein, chloroplastic [Gracilariopsis chorda]|uniref:Glutamyl-tRNA reductase-binding protein, chloroplastic n=1 Tax=Gracilariopsis chorda TaxID=448386 RepID=A0A2V3J533_9FLOR|nr:Glutamyl-tRNA reductase-binding protein, chloroplastic [Gracilariopsis chorda]|eukprot:PXF49474.1 Glutamyl-tRNA reductase-binding protein, chloroplastic [Gracilariopsis chorda]